MKLLHLEHVEDYILGGNFIQACDTVASVMLHLSGDIQKYVSISTKYDGAPSIVFGINPDNNKFFIGTKAVFNKTPKICYNEADIVHHYGHDPGLEAKLVLSMCYLEYEFTHNHIPSGVYQADIMYMVDSKEYDDQTVFFTPNTITYKLNKESELGQEILSKDIGFVVHTRYEGSSLSDMRARFDVDHSRFNSPNVAFINPSLNGLDYMLTELQSETVTDFIGFCERSYATITDRSIFTRHAKMLKMFINHCVRIGESGPEVSMYRVFLSNRDENLLMADVDRKRAEFSAIFAIHRTLVQCKKIVMNALNKIDNPFFTEINGTPSKGEGFVIVYHGVPCKFIDRFEFSMMNFANKRFVKA